MEEYNGRTDTYVAFNLRGLRWDSRVGVCMNDEVVEVGLAVASGAMDDETLLAWVRVHRV